jgi:hypothetical protein
MLLHMGSLPEASEVVVGTTAGYPAYGAVGLPTVQHQQRMSPALSVDGFHRMKSEGAGGMVSDFNRNLDLVIDIKGPGPTHDFCTERLTRRSPRKKPRTSCCYNE